MRVRNFLQVSTLLPGLCLAALPVFAQQQQQNPPQQQQTGDTLADAARKAREQQKAAPKPKKVYTDDDVKPASPAPEAGAAGAGQAEGAAQASEKAGGAAAAPGAGGAEDPETMWRRRFAEQRQKIATAEKELDILQREAQKAQVQYYSDPQKALMEQNTRQEINDKNAKIDQKKQEIAKLNQQLDDMEDELRKSGGDPGWARE
jgi:hypothetical protein